MGRLIYGGSFNPLHTGHMRLAIGAFEMLASQVDALDFLPVYAPPHKDAAGLLPFELRVKMIGRVLAAFPAMGCCTLESLSAGPAYTFDTLGRYQERHAGQELYFLLGSGDYELLPTWHRGLELDRLANLVVAPRGDFSGADFMALTARLWPQSRPDPAAAKALGDRAVCMRTRAGAAIYYLPLPVLEISASLIRALWLRGRNIDYLAPPEILDALSECRAVARRCWQETVC